jgi:hypothetical protein
MVLLVFCVLLIGLSVLICVVVCDTVWWCL